MRKAIALSTRAFALVAATLLLAGCKIPYGFGDSGGPVAQGQWDLLMFIVWVMAILLVIVYGLLFTFLFKYRRTEGNTSRYIPDWDSSKVIGVLVWAGPIFIIALFGVQVWSKTHSLDPYKPVAGQGEPLEIQAIAVDWKWVFVYPKENLATVNEMAVPIGRPVSIRITSDTVMNSLIIQGLAGQVFAMAGMESRLNLRADQARDYEGRNMLFSGSGFPRQFFKVKAIPEDQYEAWVNEVKGSGKPLDQSAYMEIRHPKSDEPLTPYPVTYFSSAPKNLFMDVIASYATVLPPATEADAKLRPPGSPEPAHHH